MIILYDLRKRETINMSLDKSWKRAVCLYCTVAGSLVFAIGKRCKLRYCIKTLNVFLEYTLWHAHKLIKSIYLV